MSEAASQEFWDTFACAGNTVSTCACGRVNFATGQYSDLGEDEIEELRESLQKNPDKYVECADDSLAISPIGGVIVYGCPCGTAKRYELFLDVNREEILTYYRKKLEVERAKSASLADGLEGLEQSR